MYSMMLDQSQSKQNLVTDNSDIVCFRGCLEGRVKRPDYEKLLEDPLLKYSGLCQNENGADLRVELQVYASDLPIGPPVTTSYKPFSTRWSKDSVILNESF